MVVLCINRYHFDILQYVLLPIFIFSQITELGKPRKQLANDKQTSVPKGLL